MLVFSETRGLRAPGRFEVYWKRWSLAFEFIYTGGDEDRWPWMLHFHFLLLSAFIHFPLRFVPAFKKESYMRDWQRWGFSLGDDAIHFYWNEHSKIWWLPWFNKIHQRHEVRRADGSWVPYVGTYERDKQLDGREEFTFSYRYVLRNGTVQERTATVYVERRAWRPRWFTWTSLFEDERQSISVAFSDEVGERTGSWKGGCVGCGWEMLSGETAEQTLRRMGRERKFD